MYLLIGTVIYGTVLQTCAEFKSQRIATSLSFFAKQEEIGDELYTMFLEIIQQFFNQAYEKYLLWGMIFTLILIGVTYFYQRKQWNLTLFSFVPLCCIFVIIVCLYVIF